MTSITRTLAAAALGSALLFAPASFAAGDAASASKKGEPTHHGERVPCACPMHAGSAERTTPAHAQGVGQSQGHPVMTSDHPQFTDQG